METEHQKKLENIPEVEKEIKPVQKFKLFYLIRQKNPFLDKNYFGM